MNYDTPMGTYVTGGPNNSAKIASLLLLAPPFGHRFNDTPSWHNFTISPRFVFKTPLYSQRAIQEAINASLTTYCAQDIYEERNSTKKTSMEICMKQEQKRSPIFFISVKVLLQIKTKNFGRVVAV